MLAYEKQQREQRDAYQRQMEEKEKQDIQTIVTSGDLGFIQLESDQQKKKFMDDLFKLAGSGAPALELQLFYFLGALSIMLIGPGGMSLDEKRGKPAAA